VLTHRGQARTADSLSLGTHSLTGDIVNTFVPLEKLETIDLQDYHEVWLTTSERWPQDPETSERMCLWRGKRELTQDVEIDDLYFQNLPRLWVVVDRLDDETAVNHVEQAVIARSNELALPGEFHPEEKPNLPCGSENNTDLRS
jgi:hypothetical protein